jgi:3-oxoacyl-[acyl-carrier-protein] synthase II
VTGAGVVTALGFGWEANASGFREGRRAFRPVTVFDASRQRTKVAAEVDFALAPSAGSLGKLSQRRVQRMERAGRMLAYAALEAMEQSRWQTGTNVPLVLGTTSGGMTLGEDFFRAATRNVEQRHQPHRVRQYQCQQQALDVQDAFGLNGPITIIANACASGANAVGHALDLMRRGDVERVFCGGYDGVSQLVFAGFDCLQALSTTVCRPFDAKRDGLALGEGAAMFCLETLAAAERRGATILGEVCGYGAATDVHHLTQPHPEGNAALASMNAACADARVAPEQIGYINAHGTGTPLNDGAEAAAINRWAGARAATLPVSSTKASIGHLLGAAGAVEVGVCLMALQGQWLPPTRSVETPDPACGFPLVREPASANFDYALTNSFGFGGANASLVLRRWA